MANGRVQVQGVGSAPKLQAVVNAGGQYRVQTQQAGENKLQKLAGALSQINPILQNYGAIQDIDAEMHEDDLKRLSDVEAKKLSQTEQTLDREVRKGNIPFFGSPLNWKRKKRALGKRMHDVFFNELMAKDGRLYNPIEGDDGKNTAEIVEEEMRRFVEDNPGLRGEFEKEGFQEALNPTITRLTAQFDGEKARIAKGEILLENTSDIYRRAKDAMLDTAQYDIDMAGALGDWKELNAFNAGEQLKVIENVAKQLAKVDERKAYNFLKWADQNLKVGNTHFNKMEDQYDRIQDIIEKEVEVQGRLEDSERRERLEDSEAEFVLAFNAIQHTGTGEYDGNTYSDVNMLLRGAQMTVAEDADPIYGSKAQLMFEAVTRGDVDGDEYARRKVIQESVQFSRISREIERKLLGNVMDDKKLQADNRFAALNYSLGQELRAEVEDEIKLLIRQGKAQNPIEAAGALDEFINKKLELLGPTVKDSIEKLKTRVKEEEDADKEASRVTTTTGDTEAVTASWGDDPEDIVKNVQQNRSVLSNKATPDEERKKALNYIRKNIDPTLSHFARIAAPNSRREKRVGGANRLVGYVAYTPKQRKEATDNYFELARLSGVFALPNALQYGVTRDGFKFDPKKIEPTSTVLLTVPQVNSVANISDPAKVPADIKNVIRLIGYKGDALTFVRKQRKLHVFLNNIK